MQPSKIEWLTDPITGQRGYSLNPIKGYCPNPNCVLGEDCYARTLYRRFGWDRAIRFVPEVFEGLGKKPKRFFVGSTMELMGGWIQDAHIKRIIDWIEFWHEHTFIILTKIPGWLQRWNPWPSNCWVGATVCNNEMFRCALEGLAKTEAKVKFISFEPILETIEIEPPYTLDGISWVILGGKTGRHKFYPRLEWIDDIVSEANRLNIPQFWKRNLQPVIPDILRQEYPRPI